MPRFPYVAQAVFLIPAAYAQLEGWIWVDVALKAIGSVAIMLLSVVVMVLTYFDLRVRREGLDILQRIKPEMTVQNA